MENNKDSEWGAVKYLYTEGTKPYTECELCQAISATVMGLCGLFLIKQRNNFGKVNMVFQTVLGTGLFGLGALRALDLPPFGYVAEQLRKEERNKAKTK